MKKHWQAVMNDGVEESGGVGGRRAAGVAARRLLHGVWLGGLLKAVF